MSIQKKEYELSIWSEILGENGQKEEHKEYIIGAHDMDYLGRATNIKFTKKLNGTHSLTFQLPDRFYDSEKGEYVKNEFVDQLFNEKKVKLKYMDEWYEFYIKTISDAKNFKSYMKTYTCSDAFIDELARNGYGITFDESLYNNVEEVGTFTEQILEDSIWYYSPENNWGDFTEYIEEKMFRVPASLFGESIYAYPLKFKVNGSNEKIINQFTKESRPLEMGDDLSREKEYFWDAKVNGVKTNPLIGDEVEVEHDGYIYIFQSAIDFCYKTTKEGLIATEEIQTYGDKSYALAPTTVDPNGLIQFMAFPPGVEVEIDEAGLIVNKDYHYVMTVQQWNDMLKKLSDYFYIFESITDRNIKDFKTAEEVKDIDHKYLIGNWCVYYEGYLNEINGIEVINGKKISISDRTEINISDEIDQYVKVYNNKIDETIYDEKEDAYFQKYNFVNPDNKWVNKGNKKDYKICSVEKTRQIVPQLARNLIENGIHIKSEDGWEVAQQPNGLQSSSSTIKFIEGERDEETLQATKSEGMLEITSSALKDEEYNPLYNTVLNFGIVGQGEKIESGQIYCLGIEGDLSSNDQIIISEGGVIDGGGYSLFPSNKKYAFCVNWADLMLFKDEDKQEDSGKSEKTFIEINSQAVKEIQKQLHKEGKSFYDLLEIDKKKTLDNFKTEFEKAKDEYVTSEINPINTEIINLGYERIEIEQKTYTREVDIDSCVVKMYSADAYLQQIPCYGYYLRSDQLSESLNNEIPSSISFQSSLNLDNFNSGHMIGGGINLESAYRDGGEILPEGEETIYNAIPAKEEIKTVYYSSSSVDTPFPADELSKERPFDTDVLNYPWAYCLGWSSHYSASSGSFQLKAFFTGACQERTDDLSKIDEEIKAENILLEKKKENYLFTTTWNSVEKEVSDFIDSLVQLKQIESAININIPNLLQIKENEEKDIAAAEKKFDDQVKNFQNNDQIPDYENRIESLDNQIKNLEKERDEISNNLKNEDGYFILGNSPASEYGEEKVRELLEKNGLNPDDYVNLNEYSNNSVLNTHKIVKFKIKLSDGFKREMQDWGAKNYGVHYDLSDGVFSLRAEGYYKMNQGDGTGLLYDLISNNYESSDGFTPTNIASFMNEIEEYQFPPQFGSYYSTRWILPEILATCAKATDSIPLSGDITYLLEYALIENKIKEQIASLNKQIEEKKKEKDQIEINKKIYEATLKIVQEWPTQDLQEGLDILYKDIYVVTTAVPSENDSQERREIKGAFVLIRFSENIENPYFAIEMAQEEKTRYLKRAYLFKAYTKGIDFFPDQGVYKYSGRELTDDVMIYTSNKSQFSPSYSEETMRTKVLFENDVMPGDTYGYQKYFIQQVYTGNGKNICDTFKTKEFISPYGNVSSRQLPYSAAQFTEDDLTISTSYIDLNNCKYYNKTAKAYECDCNYKEGGYCMYQKYGYCPYLFETEKHCRRIRTLKGEKSNRFNLTQELSKVFEIYPIYWTNHDYIGKVCKKEDGGVDKKVFYITEKGKENQIGFRYGINLSNISRNLKSDQIVTKLYVQDVDSSISKTGLCSIKTAPDNISKSNFIIDFSYYIQKGILTKEQVEKDLYGVEIGDLAYLKRIGMLNAEYDKISNLIINLSSQSFTELEANVQVNLEGIQTSQLQIAKLERQASRYKNRAIENEKDGNTIAENQTYQNYQVKIREQYSILYQLIKELFCNSLDQLDGVFQGTLKQPLSDPPYQSIFNENNYTVDSFKDSVWYKNHEYLSCGMLGQYNQEYLQLQKWKKEQANYLRQINEITLTFFKKYEPYLKEGTWSDGNYLSDNAYYFGAREVSAQGAIPKVEYTISVIDLEDLEGYEDFTFDIADTSYVEDEGMFGTSAKTGLPNKLKVLISEISYDLDLPNNNSIKVQNFTTQFEDLFQQVSASVQSLSFNENIYKRASNFTSTQNLKGESLQGALDSNNITLLKTEESNIELDSNGQMGSDINNHSNQYKLNGQGLFFSNNGGQSWNVGVGPAGINADYIKVGTLDAGKVRIVDNDYVYFYWDKEGIVALRNPVNNNYQSFNDFAVFNKNGLSIVQDGKIRLRSGYEFNGKEGFYSSEVEQGEEIGFFLYDINGNPILTTNSEKEDNLSLRLSLKGEMLCTTSLESDRTITEYHYTEGYRGSKVEITSYTADVLTEDRLTNVFNTQVVKYTNHGISLHSDEITTQAYTSLLNAIKQKANEALFCEDLSQGDVVTPEIFSENNIARLFLSESKTGDVIINGNSQSRNIEIYSFGKGKLTNETLGFDSSVLIKSIQVCIENGIPYILTKNSIVVGDETPIPDYPLAASDTTLEDLPLSERGYLKVNERGESCYYRKRTETSSTVVSQGTSVYLNHRSDSPDNKRVFSCVAAPAENAPSFVSGNTTYDKTKYVRNIITAYECGDLYIGGVLTAPHAKEIHANNLPSRVIWKNGDGSDYIQIRDGKIYLNDQTLSNIISRTGTDAVTEANENTATALTGYVNNETFKAEIDRLDAKIDQLIARLES